MRKIAILSTLTLFACGDKGDTGTGGTDDTGISALECDDDVCVLSGVITEDLTLTADTAWLLRGGVFVGDDINPTTLTVEPGTIVYGESSTDGMLVVRRNSQILANGAADSPIVFTSSKAPGSRARGDWGGLILNGNAPINVCAGDGEACEAYGEGGTGWYGGDDPTDSSGTLSYVRVEFAGTLISPDNELNGIAFQAVGSGTTIDNIHVHMNADDGVEFFGGTAQATHVIVTGAGDDSLDWTDGWQGSAEYMVLQQYADAGDNGIEADNNGEDNSLEPRSNPSLSKLTIIGVADSETSDLGILLREGTAVSIDDAVVVDFNEGCLDVDHADTYAQFDAGQLQLSNVTLSCATAFYDDGDEDDNADTVQAVFDAGSGNEIATITLDGFDSQGNGGAVDGDDWTTWTEYPEN